MLRLLLAARLRLAVRVVVLSLLILTVFWTAAFALLMLTAWLRGQPVAGAGMLVNGAVCGLIAALFVAVFHLRKEVIQLPAPRPEALLERVKIHLGELGYTAQVETPERLVLRPALMSLLFGAGIEVRLADGTATLSGPKVYLEMLRHRLRMESYFDQAERGTFLLRQVRSESHDQPLPAPRAQAGTKCEPGQILSYPAR